MTPTTALLMVSAGNDINDVQLVWWTVLEFVMNASATVTYFCSEGLRLDPLPHGPVCRCSSDRICGFLCAGRTDNLAKLQNPEQLHHPQCFFSDEPTLWMIHSTKPLDFMVVAEM